MFVFIEALRLICQPNINCKGYTTINYLQLHLYFDVYVPYNTMQSVLHTDARIHLIYI